MSTQDALNLCRRSIRTIRLRTLLMFCFCVGLAVGSISSPVAAPNSVVPLCAAAANASGARGDRGAWRLTGTAHIHGVDQSFEMVFDSRCRFRMAENGPLPQIDGFDGSACWTDGPSRVPHRLILADRDINRLIAWTVNGEWAEGNAPLMRTLYQETGDKPTDQPTQVGAGEIAVTLEPKGGVVPATLVLDAATSLPKALRYGTDSGEESWTFSGYKPFDARTFPTHIIHRAGSQDDVIDIAAASRTDDNAADYRMPRPDSSDFEWDAAASNRVEINAIGDHLFVRPKVDGQDLGWFFLDTGADVLCLDPGAAKKLNLPVLGGDTTAGGVAVLHTDYCKATTFRLGPLTLKNPVFAEFDVAQFSKYFNIPIVGICGYDFIARAALDIDPHTGTMLIYPPGRAPLPADATWTHIGFNENTPCLVCRFAGDHQGYFNLDTGSNSTVDFFTPAVQKFQLVAHRKTTQTQTGGAGGSADSLTGKIDWFEIGGTRIDHPTVGFQQTRTGVFASPYFVGNVGMGFLGSFRLIFDYRNERMAFVPLHKGSENRD